MRKKSLFVIIVAFALVLCSAALSAEKYAKGMIIGFGEKLSDPQQAIMKVQLGASTQSGIESIGESVEPITVPMSYEKKVYSGLIKEDEMGPVGVSGTFIRKVDAGGGIWVASANNDYSALVFANAFYTAGIRDSIISVGSVEPVPGMMVLGVVVSAYEKLTGSKLNEKDIKLAAEEILLTAKLGKALNHYEMGAEVVAYAKGYAAENPGLKAANIAGTMKERVTLYERSIDDSEYTGLSEYILKYASSAVDHSDMPVQLATLRAEQLWLVEPKERMMDEEQLAQADKELQDIINYLDEEVAEKTFFQKNSGWIMPLGLVLVAATLSIVIAYLQTKPRKGAKKPKK
jgi:uncharacterized protein YpuA (DUF1002 family)